MLQKSGSRHISTTRNHHHSLFNPKNLISLHIAIHIICIILSNITVCVILLRCDPR